jgi:hypothetical protein
MTTPIKQNDIPRLAFFNHEIVDSLDVWDADFCSYLFRFGIAILDGGIPPSSNGDAWDEDGTDHFPSNGENFLLSRHFQSYPKIDYVLRVSKGKEFKWINSKERPVQWQLSVIVHR